MACVNTNEKSFKELISKYGASSGTVENAIKIYMDKNNLETYDSNSPDFINHMDSYFQLKSNNFYLSKGEYNRVHALWEKINPKQDIADIKTATKEYNTLVEIFGEDNVTIFETSDGGFRVRAAEPMFGDGITSDKELLEEMYDILSKAPRDKNGNLLAPNGKKSNLTERQYAQVRTKAFKKWFGDWENNLKESSKVVDENGEPLVVYHATNKIFNTYKERDGIHFGSYNTALGVANEKFDPTFNTIEEAQASIAKGKFRINQVFLNIRNLKQSEDLGTGWKQLITEGFDGGLYRAVEGDTSFVVFDSNQIKPAASNTGTFSKSNDRIDDFEINVKVTVEYTPIGKSRQTYTIRGNKIFNKEGKEVFKTDGVDRNRIFANLAVQQGRAVIVSHKNKKYIVNNRNQIISVTTGKIMQWDEKNGDRNAIIKAAQEKFNSNKSKSQKQQLKFETTAEVQAYLKQKYASNSSNAKLTDLVFAALNKFNIKFKSVDIKSEDGHSVISGKFVASKNTIEINSNPEFIKENTILHEAIHAVTSYYLKAASTNGFSQEVQIAIKEINECYKLLKQDFIETHFYKNGKLNPKVNVEAAFDFWISGSNDLYGYTSPSEMVAELSNSNFVQHIKDFDNRHKGKNIFQRLIDAIASLFGINKSYGSLEGTLKEALTTLLTNPDEELAERYNRENATIKENVDAFLKSRHIIISSNKIEQDIISQLPEEDSTDKDYFDVTIKTPKDLANFVFSTSKKGANHIFTKSHKGDIYTTSSGLHMVLVAPVEITENEFIHKLRVLNSTALSLNKFNTAQGESGIDYITDIDNIISRNDAYFSSLKSETVEEAPIFEEDNDNMQSAKELVDRMIADSKEHIKFNPEDHSYTVDGKKADTSVTQFIHGKQDFGQWGTAASAIGTTADSVTRDFFKGELKDEYPNLSDKDLSFLKHDLKSLRNFFDKKFGKDKYTVVTEEFPIASKYTYTDKDGKLKEGVMAGTMDMLIYDNEGNFYIYDMKTSRSGFNEDRVAGYAKQLTLYKAILEANYPELRGKIKELKLIQFRVGYPAPGADSIYSATDGQLYLNNVPIQETEDYYAPHLDFTGNNLDNQVLVPVEPVSMNILFEGMTEDEVESMREETREPESTEFSQNEVDSQRGNLYGNPLLSATERTFLANNVMSLTSFIVTHLQTNPEANQFYFGDQFSRFNFTKMSREDIINTVGVTKIFEYIKERWYNPDNRTDIDDFDTLDKLQIAYDNWAALVKSAYAKLITLEGVTVVAARPDEISREDIEISFQEQIDAGELEEKEREYWQLGIRNISARSSLSGDIRRSFERLFAIDSNGNPIKDKFGFNFDTFVDSGVAVNSILEWTRTATTVEEMEEILDGMKDSYPWLNSILNKIKEEPFRSQFFQNFRKDFTQYSIVTVERDEKGNKVYQTQIINTKGASQSILDEITTYYNSGLMQNIIITADGIEGKGRVNVKNVEALKAEKDKIVSDLKGAFTAVRKEVYNNTLKNSVPKITKLLNELGIRVDTKTVSNTIVGKGRPKDINNSPVMKLLSEMSYMFDTLLSKKSSTSYNPLLKGEEKNIYGNYKSIVGLMSRYIQDSIESSSYENGKMHYSFVTPSYMGKLILNLKDAIGNPSKFNSFMEENYGSYRWFREEDGTWNNAWLELISESKDARQGLEHKVQLSFDGTPYTDLSELGYTLSLMSEYFYDKGSRGKGPQWAWYRVPILSNKPSSEFIRFKRYSGSEYKRRIKRGLKMVLNQEILRIQTVLDRAANPNIEKIGVKDKTTFDISDKILEENPSLQAKLSSKNDSGVREPLEHSDLVKDGKLITAASGASFKFLEAFNQNIVEGDELGMMLIDKINGVSVNEDSFDKLVNQNLDSYMDIIVSKEISQWEKIGLFDTEEVRRGEDVETRYKYIPNLTRSYSTIKKELFGKERRLSKEQKSEIIQVMESEAKANLEEYVWNDMFATINIIQLTATDLAYYKNVEDFQKRYAQVHSPAMRLNITARDSKGRLYSTDGMERTMYLSDYKVESDIIPNVEEVFDQKISSISDPSEKANMKMMKDLILDSFKDVNVADAQGYSSPTSYRKKMGMMGKWSDEMEEAYNRIKRGDFNVNDLGVVWQPLKPFVYSQIRKPSGSNALSELKVPVQNKNSEYLLLLADALMRGGKKQSKLAAIFDFMEESAYDGRKTKYNPKTNSYEVIEEGSYNGIGVDTVQFISAVNSGAMGAVNINNAETYEEIKNILNSSVYFNEDRTPSSDNNNDRYNTNYVHTIPFEDYGIQQEVPAHLADHEQLMGSQMRILSISDITPGTKFQVGDRTLESDKLIEEYQNLIKENIEESFNQLCKDFKIHGTRLERNKALERILQEAIEKDQRYGADLQRACSLDSNGEFIIPLSDPIQSTRIQQLLNSIIKSRINKQKVSGGPVVQASVFGMSDDLTIRFKDKEGNLIESYNEFIERKGLQKDKKSYEEYKNLIDGEQGSVAYFECYMPIPSAEIEKALTKYDSNGHPYIMSVDEAIKEGVLNEEMLQAIGYRIPTEDKYSMIPMKVKGFLPKAAGEALMLPKEITLLTGSDFDVDKVYVMLKTFEYKERTNWNQLKKDFLNTKNVKGEERKQLKNNLDMTVQQIQVGQEFSEGSFEMEVYDYYSDNKSKYKKSGFELVKKGTSDRNNKIFDLQWAVLTNADTMSKMFNPGSFDVQKKTARIVRILQETTGHTYKELSGLTVKQLDGILNTSSNKNIIFSTSQVYFHKQNMTAGKLIGIFANNNTSHAFISMQGIDLKLGDDLKFTFDGVTVDENQNNRLDPLKGKNGSLISKTIAGFLAASVDAVKDPVLNFMNLNTFTSGPAMVLARLGFDSDSIGLLLSQPIIRRVTDEYFRRNNEGYISAEDLIDEFLEQDKNAKGYEKTLTLTNFSKEELAQGVSLNSDKGDFQIRALILFKRLSKISQDLGTLTFLTKFNSVTNAVGPTIADTLVMKQRYKKFLDKFEDNNAIFSDNAKNVIQNSPILDAFYTTTVSDTGASQLIFQGYFPQYSDKFNQVLGKFRETTKANADSKTINSLVSDFVLYKLTGGPNPVFNSDGKVREEFIHDFIVEFKEKAAGIVDNELIKIITVKPSTGRCPVPTLEAKTGGYTQDVQERVRDAWTNLITNESTRDLGVKLFFYNMYRTGLSFSPKTFLHLASTDVKLAIPGYVESIRDVNYNDSFDVNDFLLQYRRNHTDNFRVVPHITQRKGIASSITEDGAGNRKITFTFASDSASSQFIVKKVKRGSGKVSTKETIAAPVIIYNDRVYFNPEINQDGSITYTETTTLGNTNNFLEYDMNESGSEIKTSIQRTSEEDVHEKEVQESPSREVPEDDGEAEAVALSETDVESILNEVFDEGELNSLMTSLVKGQSKKVDKYKSMIEEHTDSETASKIMKKMIDIVKGIC